MPDVFLSYSREDQARARRFAEALEREGFSVWWDQELSAGEAFDEVTEKALTEARAVVVLWSPRSVSSRWVRAEAAQADESGTLVPVFIEPCNLPVKFKLTQTADLSRWEGNVDDAAWQSFVAGLRRSLGKAGGGVTGASASATAMHQAIAARPARRTGWRMLAIAAVVALLVAGALAWWQPWRAPARQVPAGDASIAVLPFVNMSSDQEQEYFSDGLSEELLNQLAQVPRLRVIGRTSSFAFKGKTGDLRAIGETLGVNHILEGSVRKAGNRVKITAQLIDPADGSHLWSQTYERKLDDIFAIQDEIARTVAEQLQLKLGVGSQDTGGTKVVAAYDDFLAGRALLNANFDRAMERAVPYLERALTKDPNYIAAKLWLIDAYTRAFLGSSTQNPSALRRQDEIVDDIVKQSPGTAEASLALSYRASRGHDLAEMERLLRDALAINGTAGARARLRYGQFMAAVGRTRAAVAELDRVLRDDPLDVFTRTQLVLALELAGEFGRADAESQRILQQTSGDPSVLLFTAVQRAMGQHDPQALARALQAVNTSPAVAAADRERLASSVVKSAESLRKVQQDAAQGGLTGDVYRAASIAQQAAYQGDNALALRALSAMFNQNFNFETIGWVPWRPMMRDLRTQPGFKDLVRDVGFVDYWRATGDWGDFCKPVGETDFECH